MPIRIALLMALLAAVPSLGAAKPTTAEAAAAAVAELRGLQMYAYDQAAWKATDRFQIDVAKAGGITKLRERGLRGYVVEPLPDGLQVVFYGVKDDRTFALARYLVTDKRVSGEGILAAGAKDEMSPLTLRMVAALAKAGEEMVKPGHGLCTKSPANAMVLPQDDGSLAVYILTSTTDPEVYPAGGHYRFDFDAEGALKGERRFMTGCFPVNFKQLPKGDKPTFMVLSHLLDPHPTEIHSFVSQNIPFGLAVLTTANRQLWLVAGGKIKFLRDAKLGEFKEEAPGDGDAVPMGDTTDMDAGADKAERAPLPPPQDLPEGR